MIKIWQRYFFREILSMFFFFLSGFFLLYALIDYSTHMADFIKDKKIQFAQMFAYYAFQFVKRANLLVPLALLIATIKVLTTLNAHRELVALQAAGMRTKTLMRPFFLVAACATLFSLCSNEFFLPASLNYIDQFSKTHFRHSFRGKRKEPVHALYLQDGSKLIYQTFDNSKQALFDVFWLRAADDIWRIKYLHINTSSPIGQYIDHLHRSKEGVFEKVESFETLQFPMIKWDGDLRDKGPAPLENRSLSALLEMVAQKGNTTSYEKPEALTQFLFKCVMPFLPFLVVIGIAPYCITYSRSIPTFFIYALSLFAYIAFYMLMDASAILGENQVFSPYIAILVPFILIGAAFLWKFQKKMV